MARIVLVVLFAATTLYASFVPLPLLDRTESRVVVVARDLLLHGHYFSLHEPVNETLVNYWAKPPLHYWLVRVGLGSDLPLEAAARLPAFLTTFISLLATGWMAYHLFGRAAGILSVIALAAMPLFFFVAPLALIDGTLTAALTTALALFFAAFSSTSKSRGRRLVLLSLCGVTLAVACASKGPVGLVLVGLTGALAWVLRGLPPDLARRDLLALGVATLVPSMIYFAAIEWHNPGFSEYFFLHENFLRYLRHDYGDKTGSGHSKPYGTALVFFLIGALPWALLLPARLRSAWGNREDAAQGWHERLLLSWAIAPALFFTFARNLLATYLLPALPALAVLAGGVMIPHLLRTRLLVRLVPVTSLATFGVAFALSFFTDSDPLLQILGITLGALGTALFVVHLRFLKVPFQTAALLLATICGFSGATLLSQHIVEDVGSTRDILADLDETPQTNRVAVWFPQGIPYSAYLYARVPLYGGPAPKGLPAAHVELRRTNERARFPSPDLPLLPDRSNFDGKWVITIHPAE